MPYTVKFLDKKLYQSLSFDADMKYPNALDYTKKIWVLKEYQKQKGDIEILEGEQKEEEAKFSHSSYSLNKSFKDDELVVELIQSFRVIDDFDFFAKAEFDEDTGDEELDNMLRKIQESDFDQPFILDTILQGQYPNKPQDIKVSGEDPENSSEDE
tara:strand:+ start:141 stop:608 length:468 start_codon:yes stop_codon:yes gene_type:complete